MKKIFNSSIFIAFFIILGYFSNSIAVLFLDKLPTPYFQTQQENNFFNISLSKLFFAKEKKIIKTKKQPIYNIKNFILKAIYGGGKNSFIIIEDNKKTKFINYLESYKGYKLIKIEINSAIFEKNNHKYIISFNHNKNNFIIKNKSSSSVASVSLVPYKINKKTITKFTKNINSIWQNIGLTKTKKGYFVTYVKIGSIFDKLGLKSGDILLEVNGRRLLSDADAWNLYKNRNKFKEFHIEILRNNQIKVLNYEIY